MGMLDNYTAMADNERRIALQSSQNALSPRVADWGIRNALELANAYQTPRNLLAALATAAYNAPGTIAGTAQSFLTGQPGGPRTKDEIYNAAGRSVNALGSAGLVAGPFAGRALQGVASTTKQVSPFAVLKAAEVKSSPPQMFRPERARKIREQGLPAPQTIDTYHGTSDVPGVTKEGFRPGSGGWVDGVFTTNNRDYADVFAASMDDADQPGVIATQNRGRYLPVESDPRLQQMYRDKDQLSRNPELQKDLEAAGIDGVIVDGGREVATFGNRRGTIFDRDGKQLFSDSRGAAPVGGFAALPSGKVRSSQAAVRVNGKVYTGQNHGIAFEKATQNMSPEEIKALHLPDEDISGFFVNGRYITQKQAMDYLNADRAKVGEAAFDYGRIDSGASEVRALEHVVPFSDNIDITKKMGIGVPVPGGGVSLSEQQMEEVKGAMDFESKLSELESDTWDIY